MIQSVHHISIAGEQNQPVKPLSRDMERVKIMEFSRSAVPHVNSNGLLRVFSVNGQTAVEIDPQSNKNSAIFSRGDSLTPYLDNFMQKAATKSASLRH